ncbi:MAG: hypothetical protein AB7G37_15075, partial [Solirubrobacteraceae bacterium]
GRTVLLIAHRLSTVRLADRVVVMEDGRVADVGRHEDLVARSSRYREIVDRGLACQVFLTRDQHPDWIDCDADPAATTDDDRVASR